MALTETSEISGGAVLEAALAALKRSRHPMLLWWSGRSEPFYNEAFQTALGRDQPSKMADWPRLAKEVDRVIRTRQSALCFISSGEGARPFDLSPVYGDDGEVAGARAVAIELGTTPTGQSEELLRLILEASGASAFSVDFERQTVATDRAFESLYGLASIGQVSLEQAIGQIHPEDRPRVEAAVAAAARGENGGRYLTERRMVTPHGVRWTESRGQVTFDASGKALYLRGINFDITARKEAEALEDALAARQHAERDKLLHSVANQSVFGVAVLRGPELVFEMANAAYVALTGGREVLGKPFLEAMPELRGQGADTTMLEVIRTGVPFEGRDLGYEMNYAGTGTTETRYFSFVWQPIPNGEGEVDSLLILTKDVTRSVRARALNDRMLEENERRAAFEKQLIGIVSHDLRNPLGAILLGIQSLKRFVALDERGEKSVARIQSSTDRALRMVRDLLDFTQARIGGGLPIRPTEVELSKLIVAVCEEVQLNFPERAMSLRVADALHSRVDPDRFAQVVTNLLSNAFKYSPPGTQVTVEARPESRGVRFTVHNWGSVIAESDWARLFEPMQRGRVLDEAGARSVGLGLFITRHIVEAHGGTIQVTSSPDQGTTFTVILPEPQREP